MDPVVARKTWRTLEPIHGVIYFAPEADAAYRDIGLDAGSMGYFASRAAPLGPVPAEIVVATFFNFNPTVVRSAIPEAWRRATPETIMAARRTAADRILRRAWGDDGVESDEVEEVSSLTRTAAEAATRYVHGRPLFAAYAALPWPDEPHLVLWHAQTLLREFRGDGHVAALVAANLDPVEALVTHAAAGDVGGDVLQATRAWSDAAWEAAAHRLRVRGWLDDDLQFTTEGRRARQEIEARTDASALVAYEALGEDVCAHLRAVARPLSQAIVNGGLLRP